MTTAAAVKERPILFSGPMVRALLAGTKTQTRRIVKPQPTSDRPIIAIADDGVWRCPYGQVGDRLWVRETCAIVPATAYRCSRDVGPDGKLAQVPHRSSPDGHSWAVYRQGWTRCAPEPWRPSIHMPRWAARLALTITEVRVQRLHDISEADAAAEGVQRIAATSTAAGGWPCPLLDTGIGVVVDTARVAFTGLWRSINGAASWDANPWVWALTFEPAALPDLPPY
jgi:hypothetical protein